jgi:hypothetical protein
MDSKQSRRNLIKFIPGAFLILWSARGNDLALANYAAGGQNPPTNTPPPPPYPFGPNGELKPSKSEILGPEAKTPLTPTAPKKDLKADDRDIHKQVALLAQYAEELKKEVEKTDSTKVLSLQMLRKTQSIEKLAHHIATLASS